MINENLAEGTPPLVPILFVTLPVRPVGISRDRFLGYEFEAVEQ